MDKLAVGILAHVDAGKTTLSEGMMYLTGMIRKLGRVDHGDAFLDNFALERSRGITIFSKQAVFNVGNKEITLLDTPGHVDFSAEMERTLSVLDYAVLVVSGPDGVQGHTETLWRLLREYRIPTFLFINKMDQEGTDRDRILNNLRDYLGDACIPFDGDRESEEFQEAIAMCDEDILEAYLEGSPPSDRDLIRLIAQRKVFPCWFGSALKLLGVEAFLEGLSRFTRKPSYRKETAARVYKISRDEQGHRLTHLKVTGGSLRVKMPVGEEKIDQIRIYSGAKFSLADEADAGTICAVTGLSDTMAGQGLFEETDAAVPVLVPVLSSQLILPEGADVVKALRQFRELEEEEPQLHIMWDPGHAQIRVQLMGDVQTEILASMIEERYGMQVAFGKEEIMYRESIRGTYMGAGHYEPLRHYAEVHLVLSEGEPGSGLVFETACSEDVLDRNWQRLILTHLYEKDHLGVLTGSPITDMKITLLAGRAHLKHTEGGDFRQATYRAVRQGLMEARAKGDCLLLEPCYSFRMEIPADQIGRAMADIQRMYGSCDDPQINGERAVLTGKAPASEMMNYQKELWAYTGGRGRLALALSGYEPCHNAEEVIAGQAYDAEGDTENPSGSIFCAHGAGFFVPWDQVPSYTHLRPRFQGGPGQAGAGPDYETGMAWDEADGGLAMVSAQPDGSRKGAGPAEVKGGSSSGSLAYSPEEDKELSAIFEREFGKKERKRPGWSRSSGTSTVSFDDRFDEKSSGRKTSSSGASAKDRVSGGKESEPEYLLVDGYNIIFAWEELSDLAEASLDAARSRLADILCNYQGFVGCQVILVFDAYKVKGNYREVYRYNNIHIVYTKEAETADQYIEKTTHELRRKYRVRVATSDRLEQVIVMGQGAERISATDFYEEVEIISETIRKRNGRLKQNGKNYLFDYMDEDLAKKMEKVRLGREEL